MINYVSLCGHVHMNADPMLATCCRFWDLSWKSEKAVSLFLSLCPISSSSFKQAKHAVIILRCRNLTSALEANLPLALSSNIHLLAQKCSRPAGVPVLGFNIAPSRWDHMQPLFWRIGVCPQEVTASAGLRRRGVHFLTLRRSVVPRDSGMPNFCLLNCLGNEGEFGVLL